MPNNARMVARNTCGEATASAEAMRTAGPVAIAARYDRRIGRIVSDLGSRQQVSVRPRNLEGLEQARPSTMEAIEVTSSGLGLNFPELDTNFYLASLLEGGLHTRRFERHATADVP